LGGWKISLGRRASGFYSLLNFGGQAEDAGPAKETENRHPVMLRKPGKSGSKKLVEVVFWEGRRIH
jgi:hypothetical protein